MRRPVIGLMPNYTIARSFGEEQGVPFIPQGYSRSILEAGGIPYVLPFTDDPAVLQQLVDLCDGFFYTGGHDVDPAVYNAYPWHKTGVLAPQRDRLEKDIFPYILAAQKPVLGHCRGMQMVNALLGGTLYQDLPTQYPDKAALLEHSQKTRSVEPCHSVQIKEGTLLAACYGTEAEVNSFHHQAVKDIAPGLVVTATAPDGMIEGLEKPDYPFLQLVQWHPEEMTPQDEKSRKWFRAFVDACRK